MIESLQHRTGNLRVWSETDRSGDPGIYLCVQEAETERPQIAFKGRILQSLTIGLGPTISDCATRKRIGKYVCWLRSDDPSPLIAIVCKSSTAAAERIGFQQIAAAQFPQAFHCGSSDALRTPMYEERAHLR